MPGAPRFDAVRYFGPWELQPKQASLPLLPSPPPPPSSPGFPSSLPSPPPPTPILFSVLTYPLFLPPSPHP